MNRRPVAVCVGIESMLADPFPCTGKSLYGLEAHRNQSPGATSWLKFAGPMVSSLLLLAIRN
jgi:hypothetical protein